jgi:hypothetical protein
VQVYDAVEYACEGVKISFSKLQLDETVMAAQVIDNGVQCTTGVFDRGECRRFARILLDNGFQQLK